MADKYVDLTIGVKSYSEEAICSNSSYSIRTWIVLNLINNANKTANVTCGLDLISRSMSWADSTQNFNFNCYSDTSLVIMQTGSRTSGGQSSGTKTETIITKSGDISYLSDGTLVLKIFGETTTSSSNTWAPGTVTTGYYYNLYATLPKLDLSSIKVYMGGEYKKGSPYIYQNRAWKKGKAYLFDNSSWKKGK